MHLYPISVPLSDELTGREYAEGVDKRVKPNWAPTPSMRERNPEGDVTVVEFFDFTCRYCKRTMPEVDALLAEDGNIRLVMREWPILSAGSAFAARAALASRQQGKYAEMHYARMGRRGKVEPDTVPRIAAGVGMEVVTAARVVE